MTRGGADGSRRRVWTYLVAWAGVMAVPLLGGRLAHVGLAAFVAAVFSVVWWWLSEVGATADSADWSTVSAGWLRGRGSDPRAARIQRQLRDVQGGNDAVGSDLLLARALVALIDDRVLTRHGIDAESDPARFGAVVGSDLAAFRAAAMSERLKVRSRDIPHLISRIEQL